jgi:hypothetical protein
MVRGTECRCLNPSVLEPKDTGVGSAGETTASCRCYASCLAIHTAIDHAMGAGTCADPWLSLAEPLGEQPFATWSLLR